MFPPDASGERPAQSTSHGAAPAAPRRPSPGLVPAGASPAMAQWFAAKAAHPDALLFFRMGDFYELFFDDAEAAAAALDISLTARGEHAGRPIPMCGVPAHAAEAYLLRLIRRGFRVAVAEQMEQAKGRTGKTPLRREIVRLVTPGTLTEDALLDAARPNLLLALARPGAGGGGARAGVRHAVPGDAPGAASGAASGAARRETVGAAWLDVSTGLFETQELPAADLPALLGRLEPAEVLAPAGLGLGEWEGRRGPEAAAVSAPAARKRVAEAFGAADLDAFGAFSDAEAVAAAVALDYVQAAGAGQMPRLSRPVQAGSGGAMGMDAATRASLEITRARDGGTAGTLLAAVQHTLTAAGARALAAWLSAPLLHPAAIAARQDGWAWLLDRPEALTRLRAALRGAPDLARALGRLHLGRGAPRDLGAVPQALSAADEAAAALDGAPGLLADAARALRPDPALADLLRRALADPLPARLDDGGTIAAGYDAELDAERALRDDSRRVLSALMQDYARRYGVASLKIRHHAQLGYVIEAPAAAVERLRALPELTLRQSMASGARFTTPELAELDRRINEAAERAAAREGAVWAELVRAALARSEALTGCADALALLDVLQSAARLAEGGRWCRPRVSDGSAFVVRAGRHPVVEAALRAQGSAAAFVPNDCDLSPARRVLLLTGPNMAGKSTYLRQNALIAVLAQAGLPVPAEEARVGVVDRLFSRVGAADDLARGRSTFMVEMLETAAILNQAGPRSLVVVDEIGRGTGTMDGLAIAWAVLEALCGVNRCRAIFATHFHELARLAERQPALCPHTMRVKEWRGGVVFLHEVAEGAAGRSWGVHVAGLAGVPAPVVKRAQSLLAMLEKQGPMGTGGLPLFAAPPTSGEPAPDDGAAEGAQAPERIPEQGSGQGPAGAPDADAPHEASLREALAALDPDKMTPREALDALYRLKASCPAPRGDPENPSP